MTQSDPFRDPKYLQTNQYRTSSNLDARAELHRRFSMAELRWQPWVFDRLALEPGMRVLECGCGPGWLWQENIARIPADCHMILTDLSPGMVAEAQAALSSLDHHFDFQVANIQKLNFADETFDIVIANHMLYHVPGLDKGLEEVRRVLKPNGRLVAATNGDEHMKELPLLVPEAIRQMAASLRVRGDAGQLPFRLENGRALLKPYFAHINLYMYPDSLWITEVDPLLDYAFSMLRPGVEVPEVAIAQLRKVWLAKIEREGGIHISKASGLFVAQK